MSDASIRQEFLTELELILEDDEAYGSNLQVLTYAIKDEIINGKFKDSWNKRVYEFIVDVDGISYKPAAKLDSTVSDNLPARFDAYSEGYTSLFKSVRFDRNLMGKRLKKPKCGAEGYGCGYSCINLLKTCRISASGKKIGEGQGSGIGKERLRKLIALSVKLSASGDKKKFAAANTAGSKIINEREKYITAGNLRQTERRANPKNQQTKIAEEELVTQNEIRDFPNQNTRKHYDQLQEAIKTGNLSPKTKKDIKEYMEWMHKYPVEVKKYGTENNSRTAIKLKQQRILDEMENEQPEAALALAAYLHGHPFGKMNGVLWRKDIEAFDEQTANTENRSSDEFTDQYIALGVGAANAMQLLPALSRDTLKERYKDHEIDTEKFHRYMTLPEGDVLKGFLEDHKPGETVEYHSFQSCTVLSKEDATPNIAQFSKSANVKYTINRKENTTAKAVDHFKNKAVEGEVLYPPGTKFKIIKIEEEQFEKVSFFPFKSISNSKREQKKVSKFIDAIPEKQWSEYVNGIRDEKLKRSLIGIRKKDPNAFGIGLGLYTNRGNDNQRNMLFDMMEKAGVKIDKEPGGTKYHIHAEEV